MLPLGTKRQRQIELSAKKCHILIKPSLATTHLQPRSFSAAQLSKLVTETLMVQTQEEEEVTNGDLMQVIRMTLKLKVRVAVSCRKTQKRG